ncbi:MAG: T9SS type A sorting domain-containing protein [Cyclobacteriaceae bacterium]|uniref:T9SS type A sorting domain-containing protein n=1 Tax=Reichenbachiella sp. TaxID=2184521 RepID=UPI0032671459
MKNFYASKELLRCLGLLILFVLHLPSFAQDGWTVYSSDALPEDSDPVWIRTSDAGSITVIDDVDISGNKLLEFNTMTGSDQLWYKTDNFPEPLPLGYTMVFRIKQNNLEADRLIEVDMHINGIREQLLIGADSILKLQRSGEEVDLSGVWSPNEWNVFRISLDATSGESGEVNLYMNEETTPVLTATTTRTTGSKFIRFGDGNNTTCSSLIDFIAYDSGAYSPEASPLPAGLIPGTELSSVATLSEISINGEQIAGFSSETFDYQIVLATDVETVPTVTYTKTDANASVVVNDATGLPGSTTLDVTAQDGETKNTYTIAFTYEASVLSNVATQSNLIVYPNPVWSEMSVNGAKSIQKVEVYNIKGQRVLLSPEIHSTSTKLDISDLTSGVYLVNVSYSLNEAEVFRIVKK